jgi:hypothetical protein
LTETWGGADAHRIGAGATVVKRFLSVFALALLDLFFHFRRRIVIEESLLVRRQLVQQPQELARMDALFVGDVLEYGDCAIVVGGLGLLLVQVPELRYCVSQSPHGSYLSIWNPL